jgi:hypothetical protein
MHQIDDVQSLAQEWTRGIPHGYRQIEAICQQLRSNYTLDRSAQVPEDCSFPVGLFLFESKRGPDYQFATAATLLLRSLGFSTRLVSGFYASPERYDARKRHTAVHSSDIHFWCEVFVGAGTWVTLDPTPGYEVLSPPPGLKQRMLSLIAAAARVMLDHWLIVLLLSTAAVTAFVKRPFLADRWNSVLWEIAPATTARGRVLQTVRSIDCRLRLAGLPRPPGMTLTKWLQQQPELNSASQILNEFLSLADSAAFGNQNAAHALSFEAIERSCRRVRQEFTLGEFQRAVLSRRGLRSAVQQSPLSTEVAFS